MPGLRYKQGYILKSTIWILFNRKCVCERERDRERERGEEIGKGEGEQGEKESDREGL